MARDTVAATSEEINEIRTKAETAMLEAHDFEQHLAHQALEWKETVMQETELRVQRAAEAAMGAARASASSNATNVCTPPWAKKLKPTKCTLCP